MTSSRPPAVRPDDHSFDLVRRLAAAHLPGRRAGSVRRLGAGADHVAYEVDGWLVVRFGSSATQTAREVALLDVVARVAPLAVPQPLFAVPELCCYGYARLSGVPLLRLPSPRRVESVARSLGDLLRALHAVPIADVVDLAPEDVLPATEWLREAADLYAEVSVHVPVRHREAIRAFLATPPPDRADPPVFSHNDLGIEHVLVDPGTGQLTGVIDWSDAAICDRAYDYGLLLRDLGPAALRVALERSGDGVVAERAWFYARCAAIEDLAYGVETGRGEYARKTLGALDWLFAR